MTKEQGTLFVEKENLSNEEVLKNLHTEAEELFNKVKDTEEKNSRKKYLVSGGKNTQKSILDFLTTKAKWKSQESLGVIKAFDEVETGMDKKELFLSGLCIEAIAYFIDKNEDFGLESARSFSENIFRPINEAYGKVQKDRQEIKTMQEKLANYENEISHYENKIKHEKKSD